MEKEWRVMRKYRVVGRYRAQYEQELQKHENNLQEKANYRPFSMNPPPPDLPPLSKFQLPEIDENGEIPEVPPTKLDPTPEEYAETLEGKRIVLYLKPQTSSAEKLIHFSRKQLG